MVIFAERHTRCPFRSQQELDPFAVIWLNVPSHGRANAEAITTALKLPRIGPNEAAHNTMIPERQAVIARRVDDP